jgi:hypothetical protein
MRHLLHEETQMLCRSLAPSDIAHDRNEILDLTNRISLHRDSQVDPHDFPIFADVPPFPAKSINRARKYFLHLRDIEREIVRVCNIPEILAEQFLFAVADNVAKTLVDQEVSSVERQVHHVDGRIVESAPETGLAFVQLLFGALVFGNVENRTDRPDHPARIIPNALPARPKPTVAIVFAAQP